MPHWIVVCHWEFQEAMMETCKKGRQCLPPKVCGQHKRKILLQQQSRQKPAQGTLTFLAVLASCQALIQNRGAYWSPPHTPCILPRDSSILCLSHSFCWLPLLSYPRVNTYLYVWPEWSRLASSCSSNLLPIPSAENPCSLWSRGGFGHPVIQAGGTACSKQGQWWGQMKLLGTLHKPGLKTTGSGDSTMSLDTLFQS